MKTILVTGATGFLGSHLLKYLVEKRYEIVVLKRSSSNISRISKIIDHVTTYDVDKTPIELAFKSHRIDAVMHLATSYGKKQNYEDLIQSNIIFGLNLISLSIKYKIDIFINTDTFFNNKNAVQTHLAEYTKTKKHFLDWLSLSKGSVKIANMKIHHVYGENDSDDKFSMWLFRQLSDGHSGIKLTSGLQLRDFIYVQDVVRAYEVVMLKNQDFESMQDFNIASGHKHTVKEFCITMGNEILKNSQRAEEVLLFGSKSDNLDEIMDIDNDNNALSKLGWRPDFDLVNGIRNMVFNIKK
jgi:nucleoside-diphosphate-sugar epimerase